MVLSGNAELVQKTPKEGVKINVNYHAASKKRSLKKDK